MDIEEVKEQLFMMMEAAFCLLRRPGDSVEESWGDGGGDGTSVKHIARKLRPASSQDAAQKLT